jgi:type I restriction enzyme R subunit
LPNYINENDIELAAIKILTEKLGYRCINCYTENPEDLNDNSGRESKVGIVLKQILHTQVQRINPSIPQSAQEEAINSLVNRRFAMSELAANKEVYQLVRDGYPVEFQNSQGRQENARVKFIDFESDKIAENDFLAVRQLWIKGEVYYRRPDIILYINGIPLVWIELKNSNVNLKNAYIENFLNYKRDIPYLFQFNSVCILSNGKESKIGSMTATWEFFFNWLRVEDEKEKIDKKKLEREGTSLEQIIYGLFPKEKLLDYVENFILYDKNKVKIIAQNHQFLGVNKLIKSFNERSEKEGKLGVYWHTQGSGKSYSMIFFARKVFRKIPGNYTLVIITDRDDLDGQIYKNFLNTEAVRESDTSRPSNSEEMRAFLGQNKRYVFTLIHKFRWNTPDEYPVLSERDDIIVIVDEAHRTQYKTLAENMRKGLPNAQYIAFTGTPLRGTQLLTNQWFGDYVSEYNFKQSIDDETTVPLFYQKRVPEVLILNDNLNDEFYEILEDENISERDQEKLEREFANDIEVIKRDARLDKIAQDIVEHFPRRGYLGKGMVVTVDKFTAVKMYDKVYRFWQEEMRNLLRQIAATNDETKKAELQDRLNYMREVEMAVVISEENGENEKFQAQGLSIEPHRRKMNEIDENGHDIEYRFKDPDDKFQLVFVCSMWITGFDAPTVSTMYLDKPLKGHTLMQTIARANRVTPYTINGKIKRTGEVVDYFGVFRNLKKALNEYAEGTEGSKDYPVQEKSNLITLLDETVNQAINFCNGLEIDLQAILKSNEVFGKIELFDIYANKLLEKEEWRKEFNVYENTITSIYEAAKPEILTEAPRKLVQVIQYLREVIDSYVQGENIKRAKRKISSLLDQSIIPKDEDLPEKEKEQFNIKYGKKINLVDIDFEKVKQVFKESKYQNIEIAELKAFLEKKLEQMLKQNTTRTDFAQKMQEIVSRYNSGASTTENYAEELIQFAETMREEEQRSARENLSEEQLEIFDLLRKPNLTKAEEDKVKEAAKQLLEKLKEERTRILVQDWYKHEQTRERVKSFIQKLLNEQLPDSYQRAMFQKSANAVYQRIFEKAYMGEEY